MRLACSSIVLVFCATIFVSVSLGRSQGGRDSQPSGGKAGSKAGEKEKKAPSILKNGSFEGELSGNAGGLGSWVANVPVSAMTKYEFDAQTSCDGDQALLLANFEPKVQTPISLAQSISPQDTAKWKNRELRLSACLKTEEAGFADVRVEAFDAKGKTIDWLSLTGGGVSGTQDWKTSEASLVVSEGIFSLRIHCVLQGLGSAWFDDVRLTVVPLEETKHLEGAIHERLEMFCRFMRADRGSEERKSREDLEALRSSSSLEVVRSVFSKGFSYPDPDSAKFVDEDLRTEGRTTYRVYLPSDYDPQQLWPLLLDLSKPPGSGEQPWTEGEGKNFLIVRPKNLPQDRTAEDGSMTAAAIAKALPSVLEVLRDVRAKYSVDPDQAVVLGEAERADLAAAAALGNRGEFAAAVMIRPLVIPSGNSLQNGSGLPLFIALEGGERSPLAAGFDPLKSSGVALQVRDLDPARVAAVALGGEIFRWIEAKKRVVAPTSFTEHLSSSADLGSYWVRALDLDPGSGRADFSGLIQAKTTGRKKINLTVEGVRRLRVLVSLEELAQPGDMEIVVNKEMKYQGRPLFDFDAFVESLRFHADSRRLWGAQIDIDVE